LFKALDVGGSIFVHAFGAYFGMAVARVLYKPSQTTSDKEESVYHSDLFAMIGELTNTMCFVIMGVGRRGTVASLDFHT